VKKVEIRYILLLFTYYSSEMSIKLSILRDLSVNRNVSRCHAVPSILKRVRFDGRINPIIPASHPVAFSRHRAARISFHDMRLHLETQNPRVLLRCVNARYTPSFPFPRGADCRYI